TDGGTSQRFVLNVGAPTSGVPTSLTIGLGSSQVVVPITSAGAYSVPLSSFTGNLTAVTYILLSFNLQTSGGASLSLTGPFQTVPEPAAALFASAFALLGLTLTRRRRGRQMRKAGSAARPTRGCARRCGRRKPCGPRFDSRRLHPFTPLLRGVMQRRNRATLLRGKSMGGVWRRETNRSSRSANPRDGPLWSRSPMEKQWPAT